MTHEIFHLLLWPTLACLVLTGIHAYLGLHVIERGVIFVDLALAQIAALGATIAFLMGHELHDTAAYFYSLGFTIVGAAVFAFTRSRRLRVPQESIIGIVYAVCAAASILIVDRAPEGAEHIKYILVGNLLAVSPQEVIKMAVLYSIIGVLHFFWRGPFLLISTNPEEAHHQKLRVRFWDFLFYATFGIVVTSSVSIAGVLLVFSFLIVPSVTAALFTESIGLRLAIGWTMGALVSLAGMVLSYIYDAPTGATIVVTFGIAIAALGTLRGLLARNS